MPCSSTTTRQGEQHIGSVSTFAGWALRAWTNVRNRVRVRQYLHVSYARFARNTAILSLVAIGIFLFPNLRACTQNSDSDSHTVNRCYCAVCIHSHRVLRLHISRFTVTNGSCHALTCSFVFTDSKCTRPHLCHASHRRR